MASGDVTGVRPDGLHATGRKIAGRSGGGRSAANSLTSNLDGSAARTGHALVTSALRAFVNNGVLDNSILLGNQLENGGDNVSNVASTARNSDEEGARALQLDVATGTDMSDRINRGVS